MNETKQTSLIKVYLDLSIKLRMEFLQKVKEEINEMIRFIVSLMGTLGIIAGFGFTAFQYVKAQPLFFLGEITVIVVILYLGFKTKNTLVHHATDTERHINIWVNKATEIRKAMVSGDQVEIGRLEKELSDDMNNTDQDEEYIGARVVGKYLSNALWIATLGTFFIVFSFIFSFDFHHRMNWHHISPSHTFYPRVK